jgi:heme o synthase
MRPIPLGKIKPDEALNYGITIAMLSVITMGLFVNQFAAFLLLSAILFYVFVYTIWLKPRTPQNIVIGGAAGAFPPLIGWAAVTGSISFEPIILFLIIFMWTPPHFWALALYRAEDYEKAGIPMLPVVKGTKNTKMQIVVYTFALVLISLAPFALAMSGVLYLAAATYLGGRFIYLTLKLLRAKDNKGAPNVFRYSIMYLFLLLASIVIDRLVM